MCKAKEDYFRQSVCETEEMRDGSENIDTVKKKQTK